VHGLRFEVCQQDKKSFQQLDLLYAPKQNTFSQPTMLVLQLLNFASKKKSTSSALQSILLPQEDSDLQRARTFQSLHVEKNPL